mmetsp:Transcript_58548/g.188129  ORF Transcript_58548/g.188129 Transcript_58548/m.188129 type:complete len:248 (-) Transcript_58548:27-770(-)
MEPSEAPGARASRPTVSGCGPSDTSATAFAMPFSMLPASTCSKGSARPMAPAASAAESCATRASTAAQRAQASTPAASAWSRHRGAERQLRASSDTSKSAQLVRPSTAPSSSRPAESSQALRPQSAAQHKARPPPACGATEGRRAERAEAAFGPLKSHESPRNSMAVGRPPAAPPPANGAEVETMHAGGGSGQAAPVWAVGAGPAPLAPGRWAALEPPLWRKAAKPGPEAPLPRRARQAHCAWGPEQ